MENLTVCSDKIGSHCSRAISTLPLNLLHNSSTGSRVCQRGSKNGVPSGVLTEDSTSCMYH